VHVFSHPSEECGVRGTSPACNWNVSPRRIGAEGPGFNMMRAQFASSAASGRRGSLNWAQSSAVDQLRDTLNGTEVIKLELLGR
jgi:hypothetical protein